MSWIFASRSSIGFSKGSGMQLLQRGALLGAREGFQHGHETWLQLGALHDVVDHALLQQELRPLEPLGQVLLDRLLYHAGAGERDQGARLGEDHVAQRGEAGGDASGGGVREHGHVGQALGGEALQGDRGLGHLHQRQRALLHAGPSGRGHGHQRPPLVGGALGGAGDLLAHHRAHRAAQEEEVHDHQTDRHAAQLASARDDGVRASLPLLGLLQAVHVGLRVRELQRVHGPDGPRPALEGARVGEHLDAGVDRHAVVMPALGADVQVGDQVLAVDLGVAGVTLEPEAGGAVVVLLAGGTVPPEEAFKRHLASLPACCRGSAQARASVAASHGRSSHRAVPAGSGSGAEPSRSRPAVWPARPCSSPSRAVPSVSPDGSSRPAPGAPLMSLRPVKRAPSSMSRAAALTSPMSSPPFQISTLPVTTTFASTLPRTRSSSARTSEPTITPAGATSTTPSTSTSPSTTPWTLTRPTASTLPTSLVPRWMYVNGSRLTGSSCFFGVLLSILPPT